MMHELLTLAYRGITLLVLAAVVRAALARENSSSYQVMAVVLTIPLLLRVLMIK
ncbi:MAG: hypothetical protein HZC55_20520 [Verrucomicrobia bacterium]|jgi:hypothetical protein|nr:hypothetical protein [Verrucomicrobiota bacterium]